MRFSITNLMCLALTLAAVLGWYVDRTKLRKDYESRIVKTEASVRVHNEDRLTTFYLKSLDEEQTLYEIIDRTDAKVATLLKLLSVYDAREEISDPILARVFARVALKRLNCDSPESLRDFVRESGFDLALILDAGHREHANFVQFIDNAMQPY